MKHLIILALACCSFACEGNSMPVDSGMPAVMMDAGMGGGCNVDPDTGAIIVRMTCSEDTDCNETCGSVCVGGTTTLCTSDAMGSFCYCRP